ncbi:MAG TPA: hypothetical protein VHA82_11210 [Ramlibacter sp.]|uniref:hypothetical protein n=1 Tax=Ramlibacter sp. TaxID=1917967 RepID=UPI002C0EF11D|nr:hypothetical protein [Ramlibacter sp.]HVZ44369.1 hypothetical protein [Ramlibacter sp.]
MQIHQMSVTYLPEQDRLLMRVNTREGEEMRLWLTRRLMVGLWPLLSRLLTEYLLKLEAAGTTLSAADESLRKMLTDFRKEEFLSKADFETPYDESPMALPLGEEPLLVTDVDATPQSGGPLKLTFNERPPGGEAPRSFNLELQPKLIQGLMHLLEQALNQSQWREPFRGLPQAEEQAAEEDSGAPRRPKYLN